MKKCLPLVCAFLLTAFSNTYSQGCSDAGFCTMGAMKPDQPFNKKIRLTLRSMELSFYRGTTTLTPVIHVVTADMNFGLNSRTSFQVKLPYQFVTGRLANTAGLGDISLCFTKNLLTNERYDVNFSLGTKIPTNNADKSIDGRPLPMYYQTSLGTYDAIAGISMITRKWLFATGIQVPFNENNNQFLWGAWADHPEAQYTLGYARAKRLKRGTDVMIRIERNFRFSRVNFSLGLLPIYRITRDEFTLANGESLRLQEAQGLALSGIFTTGYNFNVRSGIKALIGHKIVNRDVNADGLSRELVSSFSYVYRF
ncbi:MAG TPA: hypothetical protein VGD31_13510 [Sphingobacteriaceae bacterium]